MPGVLVIGFLLSLTDNLLLFNGGRCFFCDNLSPRIVNILEILRLRVLSSFSMRIYSRASEQACRLASRRVFPPAARFETSWEGFGLIFKVLDPLLTSCRRILSGGWRNTRTKALIMRACSQVTLDENTSSLILDRNEKCWKDWWAGSCYEGFFLVLHWLVLLRFKTLSTFAVTFESVTYIHFAVPFFMSITFRVPFLFLFPLKLECAFFNLVASTLKINFRLKLDKSN